MDMNHTDAPPPASHYEIVMLHNDTSYQIQRTKWESFNYMDQLEGWCSKNKASILIDLIFMLQAKTVVEIGVWGGKSLIPMAHAIRNFSDGKIYGIDPWDNLASIEGMEGINYEWWNKVDHKKILTGLQNKITTFGLQKQIELITTTSFLAPIISDIDILHIDGNHSDKASLIDVEKWVPYVRKGGFIVFDDTTWGSNENAVKWLDDSCIRVAEFQEDNSWGIWIKP